VFYTFDLLWLNGEDLRMRPLLERTAILRSIVPRQPSVMLYADEVERDGREFFGLACDRDLEGIVAKYKHGRMARSGIRFATLLIRSMKADRSFFEKRTR